MICDVAAVSGAVSLGHGAWMNSLWDPGVVRNAVANHLTRHRSRNITGLSGTEFVAQSQDERATVLRVTLILTFAGAMIPREPRFLDSTIWFPW